MNETRPLTHRRSRKAWLRENLSGYIFVAPYVIGLIVFFAFPLVFSLRISFGDYQLARGGYTITPTGLSNYYKVLFEEVDFTQVFVNAIGPVIGAHSGPGTIALFFLGTHK